MKTVNVIHGFPREILVLETLLYSGTLSVIGSNNAKVSVAVITPHEVDNRVDLAQILGYAGFDLDFFGCCNENYLATKTSTLFSRSRGIYESNTTWTEYFVLRTKAPIVYETRNEICDRVRHPV